MTDDTTETPAAKAPARGVGFLFDAPADAPEAVATGHKVYDRTLGQYVGETTDAKPSATAARKAVPEGHKAAVVRV